MRVLVLQLLRFWHSESGQDMAEWALLVAFVSIGSLALMSQSGVSMSGVWTNTNTALAGASTAVGSVSGTVSGTPVVIAGGGSSDSGGTSGSGTSSGGSGSGSGSSGGKGSGGGSGSGHHHGGGDGGGHGGDGGGHGGDGGHDGGH
jgi:Flp pilus assembly pilin Flp